MIFDPNMSRISVKYYLKISSINIRFSIKTTSNWSSFFSLLLGLIHPMRNFNWTTGLLIRLSFQLWSCFFSLLLGLMHSMRNFNWTTGSLFSLSFQLWWASDTNEVGFHKIEFIHVSYWKSQQKNQEKFKPKISFPP